MEQAYLKSENRFGAHLFVALLCTPLLGLGAGGTSWLAFQDIYPDLLLLICATAFAFFAFISAIQFAWLQRITIDAGRISVRSLFGWRERIFSANDIRAWTEVPGTPQSNFSPWYILTLYTSKGRYRFSSQAYSNYIVLRSVLTSGKHRDIAREATAGRRRSMRNTIFFFVLLLVFSGAYVILRCTDKRLAAGDLTTISGVISSPIKVEENQGTHSFTLSLDAYPKFDFLMGDNALRASRGIDFVRNLNQGDSIWLDIATDEYQKKLAGTKLLGFLDKTFKYRQLDIYGIGDAHVHYIDLNRYNNNKAEHGFSPTILTLLGMFALFMLIRLIQKLRRPVKLNKAAVKTVERGPVLPE